MTPVKPTHYRLTPRAVSDLDDIWHYTAGHWSVDQAGIYTDGFIHCFETIVASPFIARERTEFTPPIHIHPYERHLIIYLIENDHIAVVRLLGGQQDWQAILQRIDN